MLLFFALQSSDFLNFRGKVRSLLKTAVVFVGGVGVIVCLFVYLFVCLFVCLWLLLLLLFLVVVRRLPKST